MFWSFNLCSSILFNIPSVSTVIGYIPKFSITKILPFSHHSLPICLFFLFAFLISTLFLLLSLYIIYLFFFHSSIIFSFSLASSLALFLLFCFSHPFFFIVSFILLFFCFLLLYSDFSTSLSAFSFFM